MASAEQSSGTDKSFDSTVSASQASDVVLAHLRSIRATPHQSGPSHEGNSRSMPQSPRTIPMHRRGPKMSETSQTHSQLLVPESVYNIDEETRMGPDITNDGVTAEVSSRDNDVKEQEGNKDAAKSPSVEEEVPVPGPQIGSSFSALSFIAAQYAESDNSSPRSVNSPHVDEDSAALFAPNEATSKSVPPEEGTKQSSDGSEASSMEPEPTDKTDVEEQRKPLDSGNDVSKSSPSPDQPELVGDGVTEEPKDSLKSQSKEELVTAEGEEDGNLTTVAEDIRQEPSDFPACPDSVIADSGDLSSNVEPMETGDNKEEDKVDVQDVDMVSLKENVDTVQSVTDLSEDSKLVSNMDSVLSSGLDESLDSSMAVKGISSVIPFGENANSSMPLMGVKSLLEGENSNISFLDESSQSNSMADKPSRPKRARRSSITDIQDSKTENEDGLQAFPAERVFEYQWPPDGGEWYLLQEQVSEYLAVLSFKRKYPDLTRRTCDKLEKEFLREKGVVTETQSDLGLTAVRSDEVYDLMMKDYPDKYHEYATVLHEREKQKISDTHKEYEVAQPKLEKSKMADYVKKAAKSAADYNRHLLRERREERIAYFDLQTFMIHYPDGRYKKLPPENTKPSAYPVALIPGQFQDHYCSYTSDELRYFPLNTALYDPPKKMQNTLAKPAGSSESSSEDSSEDKSGSSSDSSGSGSGSSDSETPATAAANGTAPANATPSAVAASAELVQTPGKKSAKKVGKTPSKTPVKTPGKTPGKGKRKLETDGEEKKVTGAANAGSAAPVSLTPSSPALAKDKMEDEEEDKDKCRICKNAVLFLKYKRVETKMIKCSECGKIAHPSCLDLTEKMVQVVTTYPWQCMECKTCVECMDPYDEDKMLFCDRCDRGYHTFCVGLRCLPSGRWECRSCKGVSETTKSSRRGRPIKPT